MVNVLLLNKNEKVKIESYIEFELLELNLNKK